MSLDRKRGQTTEPYSAGFHAASVETEVRDDVSPVTWALEHETET